ncbi:MAG: helix-hairpin-helix domain-containing protein [Prevotellaceae bacterium]|jgi:DNA uptake protein ComE-like DNA-binding protein|nr:helix-hairpin-helix domain-containing protein [Prevotellaceae bacterium]
MRTLPTHRRGAAARLLRACLLAAVVALTALPVAALSPPEAIEQIMEKMATLEDADLTMETVHETLMRYAASPLNLNAATEAELLQLRVLNEFQAASILEYVAQQGEMKTLYELQYVHGISPEQVALLEPFVVVRPHKDAQQPSLRRMLTSGQHQLLARAKQTLEEQQGYAPIGDDELQQKPNARYLGSPQATYLRYRYTYRDNLRWGLTAEKDAGEPFGRRGNEAGFDFYSGHVQLSNVGRVRTLVVGDFYAQFGQGLALWQGGAFGKTSDALGVAARGGGIVAYSGANENMFFRGAAATIRLAKPLTATAFISYKNVDAGADSSGSFSTLQTTGLHNTPKSMADKGAVGELVAGANVAYSAKRLRLGLTGLWHRFAGEYQKNVQPYSLFELQRSQNANLSADYRWFYRQLRAFGEVGLSQNGGLAVLNGCMASVAPRLQLSLLHRYYQPQYQAYYASAFAEGGKVANESGLYLGANLLFPQLKITVGFDAFSFPWLRYRVSAPSSGFDALLQVDYTPRQSCRMYVRLRYEAKEENAAAEAAVPTKITVPVEKAAARYSIAYRLLDGLSCETRLEASAYRKQGQPPERGLLAFQDLAYALPRLPLTASLRYALFSTDGYASRLYAYERDVLYAFTVPAYYGRGARWVANLQWQPTPRIDLWLRCARTRYYDRPTVGEGLTLIAAPYQTELKLQLLVKF